MGHVSSECQLSYQNESGFLRSSLICLSIDIPKIRAQYKSKKYYFSPVLSLGSHVRLYYSSRTLAHIGARSPFFLAKFRAIFFLPLFLKIAFLIPFPFHFFLHFISILKYLESILVYFIPKNAAKAKAVFYI